MCITDTNEPRFESDIETSFLSPSGGYIKGTDTYNPKLGLYVDTLISFIRRTQPKEWKRFENTNKIDPVRNFCTAFNNACDMSGLVSVLRHGFKHRGIKFRVCYFKPESSLNQTAAAQYAQNHTACYRQWYYSTNSTNSVDMVLVLNGIPVFAFELKNQYTGQTVDNGKKQWMFDRDPREICFQFNKRILGFFAVDHTEVWMTTQLAGKDTFFLPFNQGSNGTGRDGGKGNPPNKNGYPTAYLWEKIFQKDSMMDILQKFIHLQVIEEKKLRPDGSKKIIKKKRLIFPRYHQLDVVRKLVNHVSENGAGHNYLIQHSARQQTPPWAPLLANFRAKPTSTNHRLMPLENVTRKCKTNIPVLKRVDDKCMISDIQSDTHIFTEGDNFHALTTLNMMCGNEGFVDVIYIDPPYNRGEEDFRYNDKFVDKEDGYKHSKDYSYSWHQDWRSIYGTGFPES